jgi:hypothetical protein
VVHITTATYTVPDAKKRKHKSVQTPSGNRLILMDLSLEVFMDVDYNLVKVTVRDPEKSDMAG